MAIIICLNTKSVHFARAKCIPIHFENYRQINLYLFQKRDSCQTLHRKLKHLNPAYTLNMLLYSLLAYTV